MNKSYDNIGTIGIVAICDHSDYYSKAFVHLKSNKNMLLVFQSVLFISLALSWEQFQELGRRNGKSLINIPFIYNQGCP